MSIEYNDLISIISDYLPALYAAAISLCISLLMHIKDRDDLLSSVTSASVCSLYTLAIASSIEFIGIPSSAVTIIGASIGLLGIERVRDKIIIMIGGKKS